MGIYNFKTRLNKRPTIKIISLIYLLIFCVACTKTSDPYEAYRNGDYAFAKEQFISLSKQGDAKAFVHLGVMYQLGLGVEKNIRKAVDNYKQSAELGNASGQYNSALMLYDGMSVKQDNSKAYEMFRKAAKRGHVKADKRAKEMVTEVKVNQYDLSRF